MHEHPERLVDAEHGGAVALTASVGARRWRVANALIGLATVLGVLGVFTVGVRTQALDTDEWVSLSTTLLDDARVQESVAEHLVETMYTELDVRAGFVDLLPVDLQGLGAPLAGVLRGPLIDAVVRLLDSDEFQTAWAVANRSAHEQLVGILREEVDGPISVAGGQVTLELRPLVVRVAQTLGLPDRTLDTLSEDAGNIVIFDSSELDAAQQVVAVLDFLAWIVFVLAVGSFGAAAYLARGRRLRLLHRIGWSVLAVGIVVLSVRALAVRALVDAVVEDPLSRPLATSAFDIGTALLRQMGWSIVIYGLLILLFAALLGERGWAKSIRHSLAPVLNASPAAVFGSTAIALMLLIQWRPGRAFESWYTGLTLVLLVIAAVVGLRGRTLQEFPGTNMDHAPDGPTP